MAGDNDWLARELEKNHINRRLIYAGCVVGLCLLIGISALVYHSVKQHNSAIKLTNSSAASDGTLSVGSSNTSSASPTTSNPTTQGSTPTVSTPHTSTSQSPVVYTPATPAKVDCSAKDSGFVASYNTWASGTFSDLATFENQTIPNAGTLGSSYVLSQINQNINTVNSQSQQNYSSYVADDGQYLCQASLGTAYHVPTCTDISLCVSEIPNVP